MVATWPFNPPLALASLSGEADPAWANASSEDIGAAVIGGIAIDEPTRAAASQLVARGRKEFLPADPFAFIESALNDLDDTIRPAINIRCREFSTMEQVSEICARYGAVLELNAHCRQPEMTAVGCGERLLRNDERLQKQIDHSRQFDTTVSVKVRAEVEGVDLPETCAKAVSAGADWLHVDTMDSESVIREIREAVGTTPTIIANNGVRDVKTAQEYFRYGADAVSIGRPSREPAQVHQIARAVQRAIDKEGLA